MAAKRKSAFFAATQKAQSTTSTEEETPTQPTIQTVKQLDSKTAKQPRIKATFYLTADDIIAIDTMQTNLFRLNGKKPEKSELVSEAIQLLFRQQNS
jgi:hypothetical protein